MKQTTLKEVKQGDYFKLSPNGKVYVKGEYVRTDRSYACYKFHDVNSETYLKPTRKVFVGFTF
jgi:hypothetical protein